VYLQIEPGREREREKEEAESAAAAVQLDVYNTDPLASGLLMLPGSHTVPLLGCPSPLLLSSFQPKGMKWFRTAF
jgi:hypothetical protein